MTQKDKKKIVSILIEELSKLYPVAKIQLSFSSPFELLFATILSAQCTDARVNKVTAEVFKKYNTPEQFAKLPLEVIEQLIFSTGFYKAKAKHIQDMSLDLLEKFNGVVPGTMDELLTLPGVGRKTANVILGHIFNIPAIVVDTHVIRISNRLGLVQTTNPEKIEYELMKIVSKTDWVIFTHYFINFGRNICDARKPKCSECPLNHICPSALK
jgi:endonuclease-3